MRYSVVGFSGPYCGEERVVVESHGPEGADRVAAGLALYALWERAHFDLDPALRGRLAEEVSRFVPDEGAVGLLARLNGVLASLRDPVEPSFGVVVLR